MVTMNELRLANSHFIHAIALIDGAQKLYNEVQLSGILKPNLHQEFDKLLSSIKCFREAIERLIDKTSEERSE